MVVDKKTKKIICTSYDSGKTHDFKLYKKSKVKIPVNVEAITDSGYQGLQKIHANTSMPKKKSKKNPLTQADKKQNQKLSGQRALNENVIGSVKRFKIVADKYRNRRKRFGLRFNLIAGIHNFELNI